jgi:hypothetical protein
MLFSQTSNSETNKKKARSFLPADAREEEHPPRFAPVEKPPEKKPDSDPEIQYNQI